MKGDVAKPKQDAVLLKDMSHRSAKRRPGKLNEREHGIYMTEAEENFNIGENQEMNRRSESAIACVCFSVFNKQNQTGGISLAREMVSGRGRLFYGFSHISLASPLRDFMPPY